MSVYRHCESASLLCGAAFLCTVEDVVNLLAGLRMFSYRTITLSEDATVTCAHSERLLVVQRVHNARAAVTCGGRSWLCTGFRESRRSEEAKAGGCGTGERAHWFLWCLSLSFSLSMEHLDGWCVDNGGRDHAQSHLPGPSPRLHNSHVTH